MEYILLIAVGWFLAKWHRKSSFPPTDSSKQKIAQPCEVAVSLMNANNQVISRSEPTPQVKPMPSNAKKEARPAARKSVGITVTEEFSAAFELLENSHEHVFLTGKAGTGKSTFLDYFRSHTKKKTVVLAPTGVAAINVRGQTLHSFFKLKWGFLEPGKAKEASAKQRQLYRSIDIVIIDEISMVRADVFDAIDAILRANRKEHDKPFGGCQICVIGDLYQLPPVVTRNDAEVYNHFYKSPYFFDARCMGAFEIRPVELTEIFRQTDREFIDFLNDVRANTLTQERLDWFNAKTNLAKNGEHSEDSIILCTTNSIADNTNERKLEQLSSKAFTYTGRAEGDFDKEGEKLPAPYELMLKVGAQVMFLKNDQEKKWVNGTLGVVESLADKSIKVRVGHEVYEVAKSKWESIRYEFDYSESKVKEHVIGSYEQFPLQLAWAITIHKSQGKTFDRVIIDLGNGAFATGQSYVALSRCRTLEGIRLKNSLRRTDIQMDNKVVVYLQNSRKAAA